MADLIDRTVDQYMIDLGSLRFCQNEYAYIFTQTQPFMSKLWATSSGTKVRTIVTKVKVAN